MADLAMSDAAIQHLKPSGLLRSARNDETLTFIVVTAGSGGNCFDASQ